jgi:class 3 adenylate cyclase
MIIFQDPDHRKNAFQAVQTGMAIRERTLAINRELAGRFDPVVINMGINSGPALVGMTRFTGTVGSRMTYTASGPATNLAARIAGAAEDGQILIGPETARRLNEAFVLKDLGVRRLKNVEGSVRLYSLAPNEQGDRTISKGEKSS